MPDPEAFFNSTVDQLSAIVRDWYSVSARDHPGALKALSMLLELAGQCGEFPHGVGPDTASTICRLAALKLCELERDRVLPDDPG